jgi:protein-tyrosine phosphatase
MDQDNKQDVEAQRPVGNNTPVRIFTDYSSCDASFVPDPYYTRDFDGCLDLIETCAAGLSAQI